MSSAPMAPLEHPQRFESGTHRNDKLFFGSIAFLVAIPTFKLGLIEPLEVFLLAHFFTLIIGLCKRGLKTEVSHLWRYYGIPHLIFIFLSLALALLALRQQFFLVPEANSILKKPLFLSLARLVEYFLVSFYMIYAAERFRRSKHSLIFAMRFYVLIGLLSSAYGLASLPIHIATGIDYLGANGPDNRVCGSFNEGGPFGLYLVSVLLTCFLLYSMKELSKGKLALTIAILLLTIALSQSKAAFSAIILISLGVAAFSSSVRIKVFLLGCILAIVALVASSPVIMSGLMVYVTAASDNTTGLDDTSSYGFGGRAAAAILVPRMIEAHPIAGVGIGNYQIVRNDPAYLQGLPPLEHWDYSGAGLIVKIAELGIPLCLYLTAILMLPMRTAIRIKSTVLLKVFSAFQVIATLQGVELHFFYPWFCAAFTLAGMYFLPSTSPSKYQLVDAR